MADPSARCQSLHAVKVEDYLGDKIQEIADLQNLDSLLVSLNEQQELQRKQLREAEEILKNATMAWRDQIEIVRLECAAFREKQRDIDSRLMTITRSDTNDETARNFEASMEKLRNLNVSRGYMELLYHVDGLSKEALRMAKSSSRLSLPPYTRLRNIASALKETQPATEGAAPHLVNYVEKIVCVLKQTMVKELTESFQRVLEKMKWPGKELHIPNDVINEWTDGVELLLELQEPDLDVGVCAFKGTSGCCEPIVLLPLEVMVRPLHLRFKYHFTGDRATNRLDKPEYFLSHVADLISTYETFFMTYLQPIFDKRAKITRSNFAGLYADALSSYVTSLLPMLRQKISVILPQICDYPQLLSHFIHELMSFDDDLRKMWSYSPDPYFEGTWKGLAWEVLDKQDWFSRWLQVEKEFALSRYQNIIETADSGEIDYDGVEPTATKPTKAAVRVNDLLEAITEHYRPLSSFSQRLRFLIDIQITIFDQFHARLHSGLEAYLAVTSAIGRTVQGSTTMGTLSIHNGVAGLERLCRIFGSADYMEKKMQDWSDDVFFLELWSELQDRVKKDSHNGRGAVAAMGASHIAASTSSAVNIKYTGTRGEMVEGALFDETATAYRRLRMRSESTIISILTSSMNAALRPYARVSTWASLSSSSSTTYGPPLSPSLDLASGLRTLSSEISFLSRVLALAPLRRITRQLLLSIQVFIWDNILMRNSFSMAGASQLCTDVDSICSSVDVAMGITASQGEAEKMVRKLKEGLLLLGLRIKAQGSHGDAPDVTDVFAADPNKKRDEEVPTDEDLSLWEVEKELFADNESARSVLTRLGIESVTETEARAVLGRRIELQSR